MRDARKQAKFTTKLPGAENAPYGVRTRNLWLPVPMSYRQATAPSQTTQFQRGDYSRRCVGFCGATFGPRRFFRLRRFRFSGAVVSFFFSGWVILALGVGYGVGAPTLKFRLSPQKGAPRVG